MILHVRVLPVAKPKSRDAHAPGHFLRKVCKKAKETRDTANSASSGTLQSWVPASSFEYKSEKSSFLQKNAFCSKCKDRIGHVGAGLARSLSCCHFLCELFRGSLNLQVTQIRLFLSCLGDLCSGGTPGRVFLHFFRKVFGPARVRISYVISLRSGFVATSKKCVQKFLCPYVRWGLLTDPLF